ncbi:MAG: acyltransferase [Deltaproteobacteria bacterium]|jgi:N-carbamoylputrescine amidase|nr:acyltransferase [Deltaproteobacteria bacterium]
MAAQDPGEKGGTRRIGLVQMRCEPDSDRNLAAAQDAISQAAREGADVVCLPELFRTPYPCQSEDTRRFDWAEPIPGPSSEALAKQAAELEVSIVASLFERRAAGLYHNTAIVLDARGELVGRYRKMHIPDDPLYYEKFYFTPGDLGFAAHTTEAGRLGVLVCWDQWFPEAARATTLAGADFLFYPTAIGWQFDEGEAVDEAQREAWRTVQRAHAISNGLHVVVVNRVGHEMLEADSGGGIRFWGSSFVADPFGRVLAAAPDDEEAVLVIECDLGATERVRREWPFLRDRRIDAYARLSERFGDGGSGDSDA